MFLAVAYNESRFQTDAVHINQNGSIDRGLCQINDACFDFLYNKGVLNSKEELFNPYINIDCYIALMKYHKTYTRDDSKALLRYQVGEGKYRRKYNEGTLTNPTHQRVLDLELKYRTYLNSLSAQLELQNVITTPYLLNDYPELNRLLLFKIYDTYNILI